MNWYLVRHGEIDANIRKIYAGRSPEVLTEQGRQQAGMMGEKLRDLGIDAIYCSPVYRAVETAEIIGDVLAKRPIIEQAFREISLGPWEGLSEDEVEQNFPAAWQIWNTKPTELVLEGRETLGELLHRVLRGLRSIQAQNNHRTLLVVTHVAIIRVLTLFWQHLDPDLYRTVPVPHGKIFALQESRYLSF
jgi:broad specificity phosphatase PhoE